MTRMGLSGASTVAAGCLVIGADGSMSAGSGPEAALAVAVVADRQVGPGWAEAPDGPVAVDVR